MFPFATNLAYLQGNIYLLGKLMNRKFKWWWSIIPPISVNRTITSYIKSLNIKKTTIEGAYGVAGYNWWCKLFQSRLIVSGRNENRQVRVLENGTGNRWLWPFTSAAVGMTTWLLTIRNMMMTLFAARRFCRIGQCSCCSMFVTLLVQWSSSVTNLTPFLEPCLGCVRRSYDASIFYLRSY